MARGTKEIIDIFARYARRLQCLTKDLPDVTRIDSQMQKLNKQSFLLAETIREMIQDYSSELRNHDREGEAKLIMIFLGQH